MSDDDQRWPKDSPTGKPMPMVLPVTHIIRGNDVIASRVGEIAVLRGRRLWVRSR